MRSKLYENQVSAGKLIIIKLLIHWPAHSMSTINKNWHSSYCSHKKWNQISKTLPEAVICDMNFDGRTQFQKIGKWKHLLFKFQDSPVRCLNCWCNDGWSTCFLLCILASSALKSLFIFILFLCDVYLKAYQQEYTLRRKPSNKDKLLKILLRRASVMV